MSKKPEDIFGLRADFEAVEDLSNFKREWGEVIDSALEGYDVTAAERIKVIDELYKNYTEFDECDVIPNDVVDALHTVRAAANDLH